MDLSVLQCITGKSIVNLWLLVNPTSGIFRMEIGGIGDIAGIQ